MKKLNLGTVIYSLIVSIFLLFAGGMGSSVESTVRILAIIMILFAIILLIKDKVASKGGKLLIFLSGLIVVISSLSFSVVAGILGIIGSILLIASNKKY